MSASFNFSLQNRLLVLLLAALLVGGGAFTLLRTPVDAFPDTTPVQVQINTVAPSLNPEEVEQQITLPIELSIGGLPGLSNVRSISKFGLSQVVATFDDNTSITDARQYMSLSVSPLCLLPPASSAHSLAQSRPGLGEVFHYVLRSESPDRTLEELRTLHDWVVKPELRKVPWSGGSELLGRPREAIPRHCVTGGASQVQPHSWRCVRGP